MVWVGGVHGEHGDLRPGGGGQVGQQPGNVEPEILQTTLYSGLWILHQGSVRHLRRSVQHLHPRQLARSLQSLSRYSFWTQGLNKTIKQRYFRQCHSHQVLVQWSLRHCSLRFIASLGCFKICLWCQINSQQEQRGSETMVRLNMHVKSYFYCDFLKPILVLVTCIIWGVGSHIWSFTSGITSLHYCRRSIHKP